MRPDRAAAARAWHRAVAVRLRVPLPARFDYLRRLVAALCGALFLHVARASGHAGAGASGPETIDLVPTLADVYGGMRGGAIDPRTPDGQWQFGQALLKASAQLAI